MTPSSQLPWKPWHHVVTLRDDLRTGELTLSEFAADLYEVVMHSGKRPLYEDPYKFFALTYPTLNLRELIKDVALRLAGRSDESIQDRHAFKPHFIAALKGIQGFDDNATGETVEKLDFTT